MKKFSIFFIMFVVFVGHLNAKTKKINYIKVSGDFFQMMVDYYTDQKEVKILVHDIANLRSQLAELDNILTTEDYDSFNDPQAKQDRYPIILKPISLPTPANVFMKGGLFRDRDPQPLRFPSMVGSFDENGIPNFETTEFTNTSTGLTYVINVHHQDHLGRGHETPIYEVIQVDGNNKRSFLDYGANGFSSKREERDWRHERCDKFSLNGYRYSLYNDGDEKSSLGQSVNVRSLNQTFMPIVMLLGDQMEQEKSSLHEFVQRLRAMKAVLEKEIPSKQDLIRKSKVEFNNYRTLGKTYSPYMRFLVEKPVNNRDIFLQYVNSLDSLTDLRRIYSQNNIVYPRKNSTDFLHAHNALYASPYTTFTRGYGVCDELAIYAAAFLVSLKNKRLVDKIYLVDYGYITSNGKSSYHAVVVFHTKKGWQYVSAKYFSRYYKTRRQAVLDSSSGVGYDPQALVDVHYREITHHGAWVYDDLASRAMKP